MTNLPMGWSVVGLLDASNLLRGVTYTRADASDVPFEGSIPVVRANNIQARAFDLHDLVYVPDRLVSDAQRIRKGDVVVATSSGSISVVGKAVQAAQDMRFGFGAFCGLLRPSAEIDPRYFGHFFSSDAYRGAVSSMARGVNINNLKRDHFAILSLPLAPRAEQKRIADKLDAILARVDACRDRLNRVSAIFKRFRQSVLAAATNGELTEEWRASGGLSAPVETTLGAVLRVSSGSFLAARDMALGGTIPVFGGNGINGHHDQGNVSKETLVLGRVGYYCGSVHLTPSTAWVTDNAMVVHHDETKTSRRFLYYALQAIDLRANDASTAQPLISGRKLYPLRITIPAMREQSEVVRRVESLFAWTDRLEARHATARAQVERLTPALLAKAFRGELVPQDPGDEPASELLERLRQRPADDSTGLPKSKGAKARRANAAQTAASA